MKPRPGVKCRVISVNSNGRQVSITCWPSQLEAVITERKRLGNTGIMWAQIHRPGHWHRVTP